MKSDNQYIFHWPKDFVAFCAMCRLDVPYANVGRGLTKNAGRGSAKSETRLIILKYKIASKIKRP